MKKIIMVLCLVCLVSPAYSKGKNEVKETIVNEFYIGYLNNLSPNSLHIMNIGYRYDVIGFELGGQLFGADAMPSYNDYSIPHSDYEIERYKLSKNYFALCGYITLTDNLYLKVSGGASWQTDSLIAKSNTTWWRYSHGSETDWKPVGGVGLVFHPYKWLSFGLNYTYNIGAGITFGYKFLTK